MICSREEISTNESSYFTMIGFQAGANQPSPQPLPQPQPQPPYQPNNRHSSLHPLLPLPPLPPLSKHRSFARRLLQTRCFLGACMSWGKLWFQSLWSSCPVQRFTRCQLQYNVISYWKYCSNNFSDMYDYSHKKKIR